MSEIDEAEAQPEVHDDVVAMPMKEEDEEEEKVEESPDDEETPPTKNYQEEEEDDDATPPPTPVAEVVGKPPSGKVDKASITPPVEAVIVDKKMKHSRTSKTPKEETERTYIEVEDGKTKGDDPKITVQEGGDGITPRGGGGGKRNKNCCDMELILNIVSIVCLSVSCLFLLCGSIYLHPGVLNNDTLPDEPYTFFVLAALLYLATTVIELIKTLQKKKGVAKLIGAILNICGGFVWFIASIFVFSTTFDYIAFGGSWLTGSLLNLASVTVYMIVLWRKGSKPFFEALSLSSAWVGNLLYLAGSAMIISVYNPLLSGTDDQVIGRDLVIDGDDLFGLPGRPYFPEDDTLKLPGLAGSGFLATRYAEKCDIEDYAGLFIAGTMFYWFHTIFFALSIFKSNVTFSIHIGSAPAEEGEDE